MVQGMAGFGPGLAPLPGVGASGVEAAGAGGSGGGVNFGELLDGLGAVEGDAGSALTDLAVDGGRDLHDVVLAVEMESIAFDLAVQIRNRMVSAYEEIFRMAI
jgi:flagellar hook-basal body complex protein FliE